jgi:hypothetical protein
MAELEPLRSKTAMIAIAAKRTLNGNPKHQIPKHRITPELLALWTRLVEIVNAGDHREFEPDGRRREYLDASQELDQALEIKPWDWSPIQITADKPPDYVWTDAFKLESWCRGQAWRQELEAAAGAQANG